MATTTNYSGRRVDLLVFHDWVSEGEGQASIYAGIADRVTGRGAVVTGIMKLAQLFTIRFLTEKGSSYYNPEYGTEFLTDLRSGIIRGDSAMQSAFSAAVADAKMQMLAEVDKREEAGETVPDDEKLRSVTLRDYILTEDGLDLSVEILSEAGVRRTVVLPISVAIR